MTEARGAGVLRAILIGIAGLAIIGPTLAVRHAPVVTPHRRVALPTPRVVPQAEIPKVEPVAFVDMTADEARAYNAHIPFSVDPNPAARPFRFAGSDDARARAIDCMATGVLYEAGDDTEGERAVAQVVVNRLRHPAFPKTVCGVIFEGQERSTGCQFSFSCDGAVRRWHPTDAAWKRAREVAKMALSGSVYRPVGYATHYHTDWVVPYWQSSLDKITAVHSHLFFRWSGWWGTPPAFRLHPSGDEPVIAQIAEISDAHGVGGALEEADAALAEASAAMGFGQAAEMAPPSSPPSSDQADTLLVTLPAGTLSDRYPQFAIQMCGDRPFCRVMAWADRTRTPTALPLDPAQSAAMTFSYMRDTASAYEKPLWNCQQTQRSDPAQCMATRVAMTVAPPPAAPTVPMLDGVRRKAGDQPADTGR